MDQASCTKFFDLNNGDQKVFMFSKLIGQKYDMVKNDHMQTAQTLVNHLKNVLTPFSTKLTGDTDLANTQLVQLLTTAMSKADNMVTNGINTSDMHDLKASLDGIWQIGNPNANTTMMPPMMPSPSAMMDIGMLQNMLMPFVGQDCNTLDFNMMANHLQAIFTHPICNDPMQMNPGVPPMGPGMPMNPGMPPMGMVPPMYYPGMPMGGMVPPMNYNPFAANNFDLYDKCLAATTWANTISELNTPVGM